MDSGAAPPPRADWENTFDNTLRSGGANPSNDPNLNMPPPGPPPFPAALVTMSAHSASLVIQFRSPWRTR